MNAVTNNLSSSSLILFFLSFLSYRGLLRYDPRERVCALDALSNPYIIQLDQEAQAQQQQQQTAQQQQQMSSGTTTGGTSANLPQSQSSDGGTQLRNDRDEVRWRPRIRSRSAPSGNSSKSPKNVFGQERIAYTNTTSQSARRGGGQTQNNKTGRRNKDGADVMEQQSDTGDSTTNYGNNANEKESADDNDQTDGDGSVGNKRET